MPCQSKTKVCFCFQATNLPISNFAENCKCLKPSYCFGFDCRKIENHQNSETCFGNKKAFYPEQKSVKIQTDLDEDEEQFEPFEVNRDIQSHSNVEEMRQNEQELFEPLHLHVEEISEGKEAKRSQKRKIGKVELQSKEKSSIAIENIEMKESRTTKSCNCFENVKITECSKLENRISKSNPETNTEKPKVTFYGSQSSLETVGKASESKGQIEEHDISNESQAGSEKKQSCLKKAFQKITHFFKVNIIKSIKKFRKLYD